MDSIFARRSIRKYKDLEVSDELINKVIKAAAEAPSAKNRQPWKYIVFKGGAREEMLSVMDKGLDMALAEPSLPEQGKAGVMDAKNTLRIMRGAPVIILVLNTNGTSPFGKPLDIFSHITEICDSMSIGASIENLLLAATEEGLGSLWIANTFYAHEPLRAYLKSDKQLIAAVALGYPDEDPVKRPRKEFEDIIEFRN
ncbi:MAG: nitroreductase family protein [Clostridiales bacterium]|nr:nitroreductase family protein [Clostridiales bacterium]